jgi:indole-3-glycerol phosphate synthase
MNLETILAAKYQNIQQRKAKTPMDAVRALASMQRRPQPLLSTVADRVWVIGQVMQRVSGTGSLIDAYDPVAQALRYERAGVDAVALFSDSTIYERGLDDLTLVSKALQIPVISQDYIIDEYYVVETRAAGAASVVLSADVLDKHALRSLVSAAQRNLMTAIVQVQTDDQLDYAISLSPHVIGLGSVEACNLDLEQLRMLRARIPQRIRVMPLCALSNLRDVEAILSIGMNAVIIAPALVTTDVNMLRLRDLLQPAE